MHLVAKRDRNLVLTAGVSVTKQEHDGRTYQGFAIAAGASIRLRTALKWYPFNTRPMSAGWMGVADAGTGLGRRFESAFVDPAGTVMAVAADDVGVTPTLLHLPRLPAPADLQQQQGWDLVVTNTSVSPLTLLVTHTVPTADLYDQAVGTGVEIGPGPNPRILPRRGRIVYYVERETMEVFRSKYSFTGKFESLDSPEARAYWDNVIVGRANDIPFDDASLDFIFSADVVEHLVNPLGHFEYWSRKLRPGGRVLAIIPHIFGCSDYMNRPTEFSRWQAEFERGGFEETVEHHRPFAEARGLDPASLMAKHYSSHFSFFNIDNLSQALDFACARFGFAGYNIDYGRNSKKIHFGLYKKVKAEQ